jgi:nucleotide-binding universal stress UspA family protein
MKPIVLATDGSPSAEAATAEALELAQRLQTTLVVLSVAQDSAPMYGGYYGYAEIAADLRKMQTEHAAEVLANLAERATDAGVSCRTLALEGSPGEQICKAAGREDAHVLVVGAHGWGRFGRLLHGSVSTYVLHHAPCPVLIVQGVEVPAEVTA